MSEDFDDEIFSATATARFTADDLVGCTVKELVGLVTFVEDDIETPHGKKAWLKISKFMGDSPTLNGNERAMVEEMIINLKTGSMRQGSSYQDSYTTKGGEVTYHQKETILKDAIGKTVSIPNMPVPHMSKPAELRPGQLFVDAAVCGLFDIKHGELTQVATTDMLSGVWNGTGEIRVAGFQMLKSVVEVIVKRSPLWSKLASDKASASGNSFIDVWTTAVKEIGDVGWFVLTTVFCVHCFNFLIEEGKEGKKTLYEEYEFKKESDAPYAIWLPEEHAGYEEGILEYAKKNRTLSGGAKETN